MKKLSFILAIVVLLAACASLQYSNTDWIAIGPEFPVSRAASEIEIFTDPQYITHPYGNIGLLRIKNLRPDRETLKRGVEQARKFAAAKGADAMILAQYNNAENEVRTPTITLIVYVLKYGDNLTDEDVQAMRNFEIEDALNSSISL